MEVHHHAHTSRKKWTHYFWEFLMLFLAVFCGFLAEYKLEHTIEHQREKKFAGLLYEDLKKDTLFLNRTIRMKEWRIKKLDSLLWFLSEPGLEKNGALIYYYAHSLFMNMPFKPAEATIQQLRSSGSLRYFSKPELYNAISNYYSDCALYQGLEAGMTKEVLIPVVSRLLSADKLYSMLNITPDYTQMVNIPVGPMALRSTSDGIINELVFYARHIKTYDDISLALFQNNISVEQKGLLKELKKEYNLK
jgi:hypothetical protein